MSMKSTARDYGVDLYEHESEDGPRPDAAAFSVALAKTGTLWELCQHMIALADIPRPPDEILAERQAYEAELAATLRGTAEKVDAYINVMDRLARIAAASGAELAAIEDKQGEAGRMRKRQQQAEAELSRLTDFALSVIRANGKDDKGKFKPLEGTKGRLAPKGVAPSCEVYDESAVPLEFRKVSIARSYDGPTWKRIVNNPKGWKPELAGFSVEWNVDRKALLAALKVDCVSCKGTGLARLLIDMAIGVKALEDSKPCPKCNGGGTVLIPGARLIKDKLRLVIE